MIRLSSLLLVAVLVLSACAGGGGSNRISSSQTNAVRNEHVSTVNDLRAQAGLPPLILSAELTAAALTQARDMSVQQRAWHFGSDTTSPQDRAARAGYYGIIKGENIAENYGTTEELMNIWLGDPDTRRLMFAPDARDIGFGWYQESDGRTWWVQVIG
jgi:uncharacterized protein YkwD